MDGDYHSAIGGQNDAKWDKKAEGEEVQSVGKVGRIVPIRPAAEEIDCSTLIVKV